MYRDESLSKQWKMKYANKVKHGLVDHIYEKGFEVDDEKVYVIKTLPPPVNHIDLLQYQGDISSFLNQSSQILFSWLS